jgi:hypothetical protein
MSRAASVGPLTGGLLVAGSTLVAALPAAAGASTPHLRLGRDSTGLDPLPIAFRKVMSMPCAGRMARGRHFAILCIAQIGALGVNIGTRREPDAQERHVAG